MFVRRSVRKNKSDEVVYLQLVENSWDKTKQRSVTTVVASLGRVDQGAEEKARRLAESVLRAVGDTPSQTGGDGLVAPDESRPAGGVLVLDRVWRDLGLDQVVRDSGRKQRGRPRDLDVTERVLFALVANRALSPASKLAASEWMNMDAAIPGLDHLVDEDACYRAMDWLTDNQEVFARSVFDHTVDLLNLEVDLLFFDTTSTYVETDGEDDPRPRDAKGRVCVEAEAVDSVGFRTWGHGKDGHDELPQIVVGMAVTRTGIPVRVWCWPGDTPDQALIRQARKDLRDWSLSKIVYCCDRGFSSAQNRRTLMAGTDGYIMGEKMRTGNAEAQAALARPGRYKQVAGNLLVKEVRVPGAADRFVVCLNPEQVTRDEHTRQRLVAQLEDKITGSDSLPATKRAELRGKISTQPGLNRYLRVTPAGLLRIDQARIDAETKLDGKYLLRTSDPKLTTEDIALGYKQLLQVERGWRDMKTSLDLRPVHHRREDRIRAHITLCWLGLLLIRICENTTNQTWNHIKTVTQRLHQLTWHTTDGDITGHTTTTPEQQHILSSLGIPAPARITQPTPTN